MVQWYSEHWFRCCAEDIYPHVPKKCMMNVLFIVFISDLDSNIECRLSLQMILNREELLLPIMVELPYTEILIE